MRSLRVNPGAVPGPAVSIDLTPEEIAAAARSCFGDPNPRLSTPCELRFGRRGSVAVNLVLGVFHDHEAGVGGGVFAMFVHAGHARTRGEAARLLVGRDALRPRQVLADGPRRAGLEEGKLKLRTASAARLWARARPLAGSVAEIYLREARAIAAPLVDADLRFLADAPQYPLHPGRGRRLPAMIAKAVDDSGRGIGIHLTYLRLDGSGKADLMPARKAVGTVGSGFIRLATGSRLVVGEGIESALAAWQSRPPELSGFGAVAAISAGGVAGLVWPAHVEALIIAPDRDKAGEEAAAVLARRAFAAGLTVGFMRPPGGFGDWNDWAVWARASGCPPQ